MGKRTLWLAVDVDGDLTVWYGDHAPELDYEGYFVDEGCSHCLFVGEGCGMEALCEDMGVELPEPGTVVEQQILPIGVGRCCDDCDDEDWDE